jgi:hypothetical protein
VNEWDAVWDAAERVCSPKQLEVLVWRYRGASWRQIASILGISQSSVRERFRVGCDRIIAALDSPSDTDVTLTLSRVE